MNHCDAVELIGTLREINATLKEINTRLQGIDDSLDAMCNIGIIVAITDIEEIEEEE